MSTDAPAPPLTGMVVADFSRVLAGPYCTLMLADLGADVVKVERTGTGDDTRSWGPPFVTGDAAYFLGLNRNKRSVALDLASEPDRDTALELAQRADVVVENFTEGVMSRFGLDYPSLAVVNPGLVYCSISAYVDRPELPGYDLLMQASSGFMSITGPEEGPPTKTGVALLDVIAGLHACVGILAALSARKRSGAGQHVRIGLYESSLAALANQASSYLLGGIVPRMGGNAHPNIVPYQSFHVADGDLVVAGGNDKLFQGLCRAMRRRDLAEDPRFATNPGRVEHRGILVPILEEEFGRHSLDHWMAALAAEGVPAAPVRSLDEVFSSREGRAATETVDDPHRGTLRFVRNPIRLSSTPARLKSRPPPVLGQDRSDVLALIAGQETRPGRTEQP